MKLVHTILVAAAATLSLTSGTWSADKMAGMPGIATGKTNAPAAAPAHTATGVVKKVDVAGGKVGIAHEAIKSLDWPAMTMDFSVKDKALFSKLAVGKKIEFKLAVDGNDYVVVAVN